MISLKVNIDNKDKKLREALNNAIELIMKKVSDFYDTFPGPNSENGFYPHTENIDWTPGFWTGQLWLAYSITGCRTLRDAAEAQVESFLYRIKKRINTDHHDMGFLYSPSCTAAYKLTGSVIGKDAAIMAADNLLERFHEKGQFFQAWGALDDTSNYRLIIDCMLNMPLLFWASEISGDNKYKIKAEQHIKTAMNHVVRDDNSTYHTYYFNPETGNPLRGVTCQGNRDGSAWARGQAWGIYGAAIAYSKLKDERYLNIFRGITDYFIRNLPDDYVPYWDFDFNTGSDEPRDSSATAIAVCGIDEMLPYLNEEEREYYSNAAVQMLYALVDKCSVKDISQSNGLLLHGTYAKKTAYNTCSNNGVDEATAWGDYFYLEALMRFNHIPVIKW